LILILNFYVAFLRRAAHFNRSAEHHPVSMREYRSGRSLSLLC